MNGINTVYIQGYASSITGIINNILVPVLISISFIIFLYGIYKYFIKGAASDTDRKTGRTFALYGIIGFAVLFSVWGIVQIFMGTLGLNTGSVPPFPTIGGSGSSGSNNANTPTFFSPNSAPNSSRSTVNVPGCTYPTATNYNINATADDGSCVYANGPLP